MKKTKSGISERRMEARLKLLLQRILDKRGGGVATFEENGVLTYNNGLVLVLPNGQEFQLTINESTRR